MGRDEVSNESVALDFSEARLGALDELRTKLGVETWKEFFNHAIGLLEWAVMQRELGRVIIVGEHENKNYREVSMLVLNRIQPRGR
ncbi:MAG: hypothetical protein WAV09_03905 [Minisyncoccia bacterium]